MGIFRPFDPQIRMKWIRVQWGMPLSRWHYKAGVAGAIDREAVNWCSEICHGRWSRGYIITEPLPNKWWGEMRWCFFFKNPNDAILFKLTFGGT